MWFGDCPRDGWWLLRGGLVTSRRWFFACPGDFFAYPVGGLVTSQMRFCDCQEEVWWRPTRAPGSNWRWLGCNQSEAQKAAGCARKPVCNRPSLCKLIWQNQPNLGHPLFIFTKDQQNNANTYCVRKKSVCTILLPYSAVYFNFHLFMICTLKYTNYFFL